MEQKSLSVHGTPVGISEQFPPRLIRTRVKPARERRYSPALADPERVVFLDVETTGLSWYYDEITLVGWVCGGRYRALLAGDDPSELLESLSAATALVTFNGTLFDLRFLRKSFPELTLPPVHIDLRYLARRAGLSGGQKNIERALGLPRPGLEDVDGAGAVVLWRRYERGDVSALLRLIAYNRFDVIGMCEILDEVLDRVEHADLLFSRPRYGELAEAMRSVPDQLGEVGAASRRIRVPEFRELFRGSSAESAHIIGIDLTGSEARPSGWCTMRGSQAETARISRDDEIVSRVLAERPALVSIDSPLSLPFGRVRVDDSDPGRQEFGIMRRCERELKRRGVNVYPSLLPSMQGLTRRGINLAAALRAAGIPVIESYPGAAQDIMGIPRKGAGEEFLKQGLLDFGIHGPYAHTDVTHDELDAITSALVGFFFLAGRYEALRGPSEDALIIPELMSDRQRGMVIGISGRICAGKTTVAELLEQRGFAYTRFSLVIDDEIVARGETPSRESRQRIGAEINRQRGQRWLCEKVLERVAGDELIVVDGLRFPEDHAFFAERFGSEFTHLHVRASTEIREARYLTIEERHSEFGTVDRQPVESKIDELAALSNVVIQNESTLSALSESVLKSLRNLYQDQNRECLSRLS